MRVIAFTGGKNVPSARFRIRELIPSLEENGIALKETYPKFFSAYPPACKVLRPFWAPCLLASRLPSVIKSYAFDAVILQREMLSTQKTLEHFTKKPRVLDIDDAIFLPNRDFIGKIAACCDMVICGNTFLANHFERWCKNIKILPTGIDVTRFSPKTQKKDSKKIIIGWTGTSSNYPYLYEIEEALKAILELYNHVELLIISDKPPNFTNISTQTIRFLPWNSTTEADSLREMDIGIMPLANAEWAKGKCSFKMIQYMATGLPVVTSPVGMNKDILEMASVGLPAVTTKQWKDALSLLILDENVRQEFGSSGRWLAQNHFSSKILGKRLSSYLKELR